MSNLFNYKEEKILDLIKKQSEIDDDLIVVGRFVNYKGKDSFINIRNKNFVPLTYVGQGNEHLGQKIKIEIREKNSFPMQNEWYEFKIKLAEEGLRRFLNNPTLIAIDLGFEPKLFQPNEQEFVLNLYKRKANQGLETDRGNIQSLRIIEREINRVKEAFIYELLQNAADYPLANKKVDVKIFTTSNEFIFSHNGSPFKFNNVYALCNINDGDKQDDADKIGYKGIGFKSVFAYSEKVLVKSGKYIFKFDKNHHEFQRDKPFQIIPIWIENLSSLKELPIRENVNFVIEAKQGEKQIEEWKELLKDIFSQESSIPVILFLRNIRNVFLERTLVSQTTREWWIREYKLKLTEEIKTEIKTLFETNTGNIPEKLVGVDEIEIQFALKHLDYEIIPLTEAILYNYLPTKVNLGFSFLVNSDFIPTGDRHYLFENKWNKYLMQEVGRKFFDWLNTLFTVKHKTTEQPIFKRDYLKLLPSLSKNIQELKSKTSNNLFLLEAFKEGFDISLIGIDTSPAVPFIPTQSGTLETLSNILIDETGLADLLKENFFRLTGITEKLIHNDVGEGAVKIKALITEYKQGTVYGIENLKADLHKTEFQEWLKNPSNNFNLIQHFCLRTDLQSLLESEEIILSENKTLHKSSSLYSGVPNVITFLSTEKISSELWGLLIESKISLALSEFEPVQFYKENILVKQNIVSESLNIETNLLNFWRFIFDNWPLFESDTAIKDSLKHFEVLCKSKNENELLKKSIPTAYLSAEFYPTNEIESVVRDISPDAVFISDKYIDQKRGTEKWRKIFKQAGAITDLQKVMEVLIPKLPSINEQKHCDIGKQIFKYWKDNKDKETQLSTNQITAVRNNLKIKCYDGSFLKASECIIADHYTTNPIIDVFLREIKLNNQISVDYDIRKSNILEWNNFFKLIGCQILSEKQNVFDAKIEYFIKNQKLFREKHFDILQTISQLHKEKNDNNFSFNTLSNLYLKTNTNEWCLPNQVHFSSVYNPKLDLQKNVALCNDFLFLNSEYVPDKISSDFLKNLGVHDNFRFEVVANLGFDEINNFIIKEKLFNGSGFKNRKESLLKSFNLNQIQRFTKFENHINCYPALTKLTVQNFNNLFFKEVINLKEDYFKPTKIRNNGAIYDSCENELISFIKENETIENSAGIFVKPTNLYSAKLSNYINDITKLPKSDLFGNHFKSEESFEKIIGIKQEINTNIGIQLCCRSEEKRISFDEIKELNIIELFKEYIPTYEEKSKMFLLNKKLEWKPINDLYFSLDKQFEIEPSQHLHEDFVPIAKNFGIEELSENKFKLITEPTTPTCKDEVKTFVENYAKYVAFKIDETNYQVIESEIIKKANHYEFYEVTEITKAFPETNPIFKKTIDFYIDADNKIFYKDYWKNNKELVDFILKHLLEDKVKRNWLNNVLNRWSIKEIIEDLKANSNGILPPEITQDESYESKDNFWAELTNEDEMFIKSIIKGEYELNEKLDANTTAKIKTLMTIRDNYDYSEISDEGRYLKAGADEIIVRSAQSGLMYLDLYHWGRLNEFNVRLAVYTNSSIKIYDSQEDLIQFTKTQNKFGILRLPDDYTLEDYNSIDNIEEKGKWHFVFIVNDKTETARSYNSIMNLDDYNF